MLAARSKPLVGTSSGFKRWPDLQSQDSAAGLQPLARTIAYNAFLHWSAGSATDAVVFAAAAAAAPVAHAEDLAHLALPLRTIIQKIAW